MISLFNKVSMICLYLGLTVGISSADDIRQTTNNNWLTEAKSQTLRDERLQAYLGGFSTAMQDISQRYQHTFHAINEENWLLADYHWDKIRAALENGIMKRPARRASAEAIFLGAPWFGFSEALATEDKAAIFHAFRMATDACMACHIAEGVAFMNQQPLFRLMSD